MTAPASSLSQSREADQVLAELVEEMARKLQAGEPVDLDAYARQHPECAGQLSGLLPAIEVLAGLGQSAARGDAGTAAVAGDPEAALGVLGDFRLLREVGRGGMGIVYEAEQVSLGRRVALKVLPFAGALDERRLQRFRHEARAAAGLHHTNIVPVYAVGSERGVHYYAMQYIEGQTLAAVIDELRRHLRPESAAEEERAGSLSQVADDLLSGRLAPPGQAATESRPRESQRAIPAVPGAETAAAGAFPTERSIQSKTFFRTVAHLGEQAALALEHAHQLDVIHRDIKPANLLVDGRGILWVTDFGLARLQTDVGLTQSGDLLGTLRYMSPEQALAKRAMIDHRADIYSLGATLYELLTLQPAFDGRDREEILRQIAQDEPRPPRRLNGTVPRELETVVQKAMAKSPEERYGTARELADDLRRFLEDRPLLAKRPSLWQRAGKWLRRHRAVVRAVSGGLAIAVVGLTASTVVAWRAYRAEVEQRQLADARYQQAQEQRRQARRAVDKMYVEVAHKWLDRQPQMGQLQKEFIEEVLRFYGDFAEEQGQEEEARFDRATAYLRVGELLELSLAQEEQAQAPLLQASALLEGLAQQFPDKGVYSCELAQVQVLLAYSGVKDRRERFERAVSLMEDLVERYPGQSEYLYRLAMSLQNLGMDVTDRGNPEDGNRLCRRAIILFEGLAQSPLARPDYRRGLAAAANNLAEGLRQEGRWREAAEQYRKAITAYGSLTPDTSGSPEYAHDLKPFSWHNLGNDYRDLATTLGQLKRSEEAEAAFARAVRIHAKLVADFPNTGHYWRALFRDYRDKGTLFWARGQSREADQAYGQAVAFGDRMAAAFPPVDLMDGGFALFLVACPDPKWRNAKRAREFASHTTEQSPRFADSWSILGIAAYRLGDCASAIAALEKALSLRSGEHPGDQFFLAMAYWRAGDERQARQWYDKAIAWMKKNRLQDPELLRYRAEAAALLGIPDALPRKAKEVSPPKK